ncbi:uncharacterized protein LOC128390605 [Panonychus citri]|uniref:uncharacterized protein LOC128390605 n=1 Tax=Panonychus citri TaxID=50023 RepID=UPI002307C8FD|nr:uncharacterized protein LOC128390605 [Panonychus citri]
MSRSLYFVKMFPDVPVPFKATTRSVGFDISSYEDTIVPARGQVIIKTGLKVTPPKGTYIRLASRSSLASEGITVQGGVIDPDYTGEVKVILSNNTNEQFIITKGMRIAQMICEKATFAVLYQKEEVETTTTRCDCGFGSSGR